MRSAALAFLIGIVLVQQFSELPSLAWALLLIPLIAIAWHTPRAWTLVFLVGGVVWVSLRAGVILSDRLATALEGEDLTLTGVIADIPYPTDYGMRFEFAVHAAAAQGAAVVAPQRVLLTSALPTFTPRAGERWQLRARLKRPHGFQNPGGFDYEAYLFRSRIGATGYVRAEEPPTRVDGGAGRFAIDALRQRLGERIGAALPANEYAGLVIALANGNGRGINDAQWEVLRQTGTLHLVAISGLHISLIGGIAFFIGRYLWALPGYTVLRLPAPLAGAIAALLAASAYAALAGFVIPTQRALIMLAVAMAGVGWCRVDPIVSLNGRQVQIWVAVPQEYVSKVSGPIEVEINVPSSVSRQLLYTDSGFNGYGERVTFTTNNGSLMPDGSFWMTFVVRVPMNGFWQSVPVQVEVVNPDGTSRFYNGTQYNVNGTFVVSAAN